MFDSPSGRVVLIRMGRVIVRTAGGQPGGQYSRGSSGPGR